MRIVIVSPIYDEVERIGSVRPRALARWLSAYGHDVHVVTRSNVGSHQLVSKPGSLSVHRVPQPRIGSFANWFLRLAVGGKAAIRRFFKGLAKRNVLDASTREELPASDGGAADRYRPSIMAEVRATVLLSIQLVGDLLWVRRAFCHAKRHLSNRDFVVFASFGPISSLWLGRLLATNPACKGWVADFRDLVPQDVFMRPVRSWLKRQQRIALRDSILSTTISEGLRKELISSAGVDNASNAVHVVPNGFSLDMSEAVRPGARMDGTLRFAYTGSMYMGRRDATALFMALSDLETAGAIDSSLLEFHYAGRDGATVYEQAGQYGLSHIVHDHGFVSHEESLQIQNEAHILLVLSWNAHGQEGILTGKVFEYMTSGKPILALTAGTLPNSELSEIVRKRQLGFAFEDACRGSDLPLLREYLTGAYRSVCLRKESLPSNSLDALSDYNYEHLSRKVEVLLHDVYGAGH